MMTLQETIKAAQEAINSAEADYISRLPRYRTVGNRKFVIHPQKDGSEKVFDMITGKEIIEGEVI